MHNITSTNRVCHLKSISTWNTLWKFVFTVEKKVHKGTYQEIVSALAVMTKKSGDKLAVITCKIERRIKKKQLSDLVITQTKTEILSLKLNSHICRHFFFFAFTTESKNRQSMTGEMQWDYSKQSDIAEGGIPIPAQPPSAAWAQRLYTGTSFLLCPVWGRPEDDPTCGDMRVVQPAQSKNTRYPWEARFKLRLDGALSNLI